MKTMKILLCAIVLAMPTAQADILIHTKNQKTHRVPVQVEDIQSIEFTSTSSSALSGPTSTTQVASASRRWVDASNPSHYFQATKESVVAKGRVWVEYSDGKPMFRFVEEAESTASVHLYDPVRKVRVWLYSDHFKWANNQGKSGTVRGGWSTR